MLSVSRHFPRRFLLAVLLVLYALVIVAVVVMADTNRGVAVWSIIGSIPAGDKVGHFLLFGTLAYLVNALIGKYGGSRAFHIKATVVVAVIVMIEEISQIYLPHRNFDLVDLFADMAGILSFSLFAYFQKRSSLAA